MGCDNSKEGARFASGLEAAEKCVFCAKDQSLLKEREVWSNENCAVIATHQPLTDGHLLVVPKRHGNDLLKEEGAALVEAELKIAATFKRVFGKASGYMTLRKNGWAAGERVPHYHMHFYPRAANSSDFWFHLMFFVDSYLGRPLTAQQTKAYVRRWAGLFRDDGDIKFEKKKGTEKRVD